MIYDPLDTNICMNELGVLFYLRQSPDGSDNGWVELNEMKRNGEASNLFDGGPGESEIRRDEFRRPEW